jgi:cytidine deaminase
VSTRPKAAPIVVGQAEIMALVSAAHGARLQAYAPYSHYAVGAAVLTVEGELHIGCNVENALFGATMCAERVAVYAAVAAGARRLSAAVVVTPGGGTPCGFCRQVLAEFAPPEMPVAVSDALASPSDSGEYAYRLFTLGELLPEAWTAADLERGEAGVRGNPEA